MCKNNSNSLQTSTVINLEDFVAIRTSSPYSRPVISVLRAIYFLCNARRSLMYEFGINWNKAELSSCARSGVAEPLYLAECQWYSIKSNKLVS